VNNNDNGFDINSIINGTSSNNTNNNTNNDGGMTNQIPGGVQQPTSRVPFTTGGPESNGGITSNITTPDDPNGMINEKLKKVEIDYKPPSKYQTFLLIVFFIFIIGFAFFLPEISSYINLYKSGKLNEVNEEITTGKLTCTLKTSTANLDMDYVRIFYFDAKALTKAEFTLTTRGDPSQDEQTLNELNSKCEKLKEHAKGINGLDVKCNYSDGKLIEEQLYRYSSINPEDLSAAFAEAGGSVPEFTDGEDIDKIEHNLNSAGYSCFKEK